jgi:hypothetical protein
MNSGVEPSVCNTTPCAQYSLYHMSAAADDQGAAPSPTVPHRHHHYSPTHSTGFHPSAPHKVHSHAQCLPHIPAHTQPPQYSVIQVVQPTIAWLTAAPRSSSVRTHSTCPSKMAMCSGVAPIVCNTTPCAQYSLYHMAADDQGSAPSPYAPHRHHHHSPTHSTGFHPSAQHELHSHAQCPPHIPAHTRPPLYSAVQVGYLTVAWLIAQPRSNSVRTHSTCPFSLAMYSGVLVSICNTTP